MGADDERYPPHPLHDPAMLAQLERNVRGIGVSRRRFLAFAAVVAGTTALAACGAEVAPPAAAPTATPATPTRPAATTAPTTAATAAMPAPAGEMARPGAIGMAPPSMNAGKPDSKRVHFDYLTSEPVDNDFNRDLYCGGAVGALSWLLRYDQDFTILPDLAESYTIGADNRTYTFKLRSGITWSDGVPVKASDFVYSLRRQIDPRTGNGYASFWNGVIKGASEVASAKSDDPMLAAKLDALGVKAVDDATLEITGDAFAALIPSQIAFFAASPAREDLVKKFADAKGISAWTDPGKTGAPIVTNGPFQITSWKHNQEITLVRNDKYWNVANIKQKYVTVKILPDITKSMLPYDNGDVDYQVIPSSEVDRVKGDARYKDQVFQYVYPGTRFLVPDTGHAPFDKLEVRKATILAIDKERLVNQVGKRVHTIAYAMTAPGVFGYFDDDDNKLKNLQKYDKAKALEALRGTTFEGGRNWPRITLSYNSGDQDIPVGYPEEIARQLKENLGMQVDLEPLDTKVWNMRRFALDLQFLLYRWYQDYPDPHNEYFQTWSLHAKGSARQSYTDPVFDDLCTQAAAETDKRKRLALYYQAEVRIQEQFAYMPIHWRNDYYAIKPYLTNVPKNKQGYVVFNTSGIFGRSYDQIYVTDASPHMAPT